MSREILKESPFVEQIFAPLVMLIAIRFALQYNFMLDWLPQQQFDR